MSHLTSFVNRVYVIKVYSESDEVVHVDDTHQDEESAWEEAEALVSFFVSSRSSYHYATITPTVIPVYL